MTDTDVELEIDPAFEAHLRRTLREVAAAVDDIDVSRRAVVRVLPVPSAPVRAARHRAIGWVAAAAVVGAATGAGIMTVIDRDPTMTDVAAVSTAPTIPPADGELFQLAVDCHDQVEALQSDIGDDVGQPPPPDPASAGVLLFETDRNDRVLITDNATFYICSVVERNSAPTVRGDDFNVYLLPVRQPPSGGDVQVVNRTSLTSDPSHGPGWVRVIGRAGPDVTTIELELADRSTIDGQIQAGWFVLEGDLGAGVRDRDERINWTTRDGDEHSSRADLLDPPDELEACAAISDCVTTKLADLRQSSQLNGLAGQAEILDDLDVTLDELVDARRAFADCVNMANAGITITVRGDGSMAVGTAGLDGAESREHAQNVQTLCSAAHLDFVSEAYYLLDAQRRVDEG